MIVQTIVTANFAIAPLNGGKTYAGSHATRSAPRGHHQDTSQRSERHVTNHRREREHHNQQPNRMEHAGQTGLRARAHRDRGAGQRGDSPVCRRTAAAPDCLPCANSSRSLLSLTRSPVPDAPHSRLSSMFSTAMEKAGASSAGYGAPVDRPWGKPVGQQQRLRYFSHRRDISAEQHGRGSRQNNADQRRRNNRVPLLRERHHQHRHKTVRPPWLPDRAGSQACRSLPSLANADPPSEYKVPKSCRSAPWQ